MATPAQKLGLEKMTLTVTSCRKRALELRKKAEAGKFKGETLSLARRWASWYMAKANQLKKATKKRGGK